MRISKLLLFLAAMSLLSPGFILGQSDFEVFYCEAGNEISGAEGKRTLERGERLDPSETIHLAQGAVTLVSESLQKRVTIQKSGDYDFGYFNNQFEKASASYTNRYLALILKKIKNEKDEVVYNASAVTRGFLELFELSADDTDHRSFTVGSPIINFKGVFPEGFSIAVLDGKTIVAQTTPENNSTHLLDLSSLTPKRYYLAVMEDGKVQGKVVIKVVDEDERAEVAAQIEALEKDFEALEMGIADIKITISECMLFQGVISSEIFL